MIDPTVAKIIYVSIGVLIVLLIFTLPIWGKWAARKARDTETEEE